MLYICGCVFSERNAKLRKQMDLPFQYNTRLVILFSLSAYLTFSRRLVGDTDYPTNELERQTEERHYMLTEWWSSINYRLNVTNVPTTKNLQTFRRWGPKCLHYSGFFVLLLMPPRLPTPLVTKASFSTNAFWGRWRWCYTGCLDLVTVPDKATLLLKQTGGV